MSDTSAAFDPTARVAAELSLPAPAVGRVLALLAEGNTVPFIARYRKEVTGGLDEVQIRDIQERAAYLKELEARRETILQSIGEQGLLTPELARKIKAAGTKAELEDRYLPFKPKRRTKATIARERGLQPLADRILSQALSGDPQREAAAFVKPEAEVPDVAAALAGAGHIVAETVAETAAVRAFARERMHREGRLVTEATAEGKAERTRFEQYYEFSEGAAHIPSHRYLAIRRGEREGALRVEVALEAAPVLGGIEALVGVNPRSPFAGPLRDAVADAWKRLVAPSVETDLRVDLKTRSDLEAVEVFARNLRDLLLASPLGGQPVVAIDPGFRTGCKCVALDETGRFLAHLTVYPNQGAAKTAQAEADLLRFLAAHPPQVVAVGNGTGGRETEAWLKEILGKAGLKATPVVAVNESGASIYSASDVARLEFPDLDLTIRGAISIGRRLQDPLAELVKIDPKSIGVGQYQHDVHQPTLARKLDDVVEDCVNHVGVALNTASAPLLARVAGIGPNLARKIVEHRESNGPFRSRAALLKVSGLGPRTYEQCAGFLRIRDGEHPLDASAVHPERYALVARIAHDLGVALGSLVGDAQAADRVDVSRYVGGDVGEPTLRDILAELKKPGRDPRQAFEPPKFRDDVHAITDLEVGMQLEGVVTNVTAFGAFVDVGVHQDGLVHISQLSDKFVRDPAEVVRTGDRITVRVLEVDVPRKRISLTARKEVSAEDQADAQAAAARSGGGDARSSGGRDQGGRGAPGGGRNDGRSAQGGGRGPGGPPGGGGGGGGGGRGPGAGGGRGPGGPGGGGQGGGGQGGGGRGPGGSGGGPKGGPGGGGPKGAPPAKDAFKHNPFADLLKGR